MQDKPGKGIHTTKLKYRRLDARLESSSLSLEMNVCPDYDLQPDRISPVLKQGVERSTCSVPTLTQKDYSPMKVESNGDSEIFQPLHPEGN